MLCLEVHGPAQQYPCHGQREHGVLVRLMDEDYLTGEGGLLEIESGGWGWAAQWRLDGTGF